MNLREKFRKKYYTPEIKDKINNNCIIFLQYHRKDDLIDYIRLLRSRLITRDIYKFINVNEDYKWPNINRFSRMFNEYCELYYVWKNIDKFGDKKIFGFGHYRRWPNILSDNMNYYFNLLINQGYIHSVEIKYYDANKTTRPNQLINLYGLEYHNSKYKLLLSYLSNWYFPKFLLDELIKYLDSKLEKYPLLGVLFSEGNSLFNVRRSTFVCSKNVFIEMMEFISGYFDQLMETYHLSFNDYDGFIKWYYENIIKEFQNVKIYDQDTSLLQVFNQDPDFRFIFMNKKQCGYMFDEESYYGLYKRCNAWRVFGYITELLVNVFCMIHDKILYTTKMHFLFGNSICAWMNEDEYFINRHAQLINHTNYNEFRE